MCIFKQEKQVQNHPEPLHPVNVGKAMIKHHRLMVYTSSTAQGGGGSFRIGNLEERLVVVNHGWQSEATDGLKGGWNRVFLSGYNGCSGHVVGHLTHNCWM